MRHTDRPRRRAARILADMLLSAAACGGLACIGLVVIASLFDVTLIMFKTGSMSPTIPAGSLAVVREIPADEIRVGHVVTVDRNGALPVTHRVTSVASASASAESPVGQDVREPTDARRQITMKGDANEVADPAPYTVSTVRLVLFSVPGLARVVVWFSHPWVLGAVTVGASALVTWAFWPRSSPRTGTAAAADHSQSEPGAPPRSRGGRGRRRERARHARSGMLAAIPFLLGAVIAAPLPPAAAASPASFEQDSVAPVSLERVVSGRYITLTALGDPTAMMNVIPGETVPWQVGVHADAPDPGEVSIGVSASGSAALELHSSVSVCTERWVAGSCASGAEIVWPMQPIDLSGRTEPLAVMPSDQQRWLLFTVGRPAGSSLVMNEEVRLTVHAEGAGDEIEIGPGTGPNGSIPGGSLPDGTPGSGADSGLAVDPGAAAGPDLNSFLARTGLALLVPVLVAGCAVLLGLSIAGAARLRKRGWW